MVGSARLSASVCRFNVVTVLLVVDWWCVGFGHETTACCCSHCDNDQRRRQQEGEGGGQTAVFTVLVLDLSHLSSSSFSLSAPPCNRTLKLLLLLLWATERALATLRFIRNQVQVRIESRYRKWTYSLLPRCRFNGRRVLLGEQLARNKMVLGWTPSEVRPAVTEFGYSKITQ